MATTETIIQSRKAGPLKDLPSIAQRAIPSVRRNPETAPSPTG